MNLLFKHKKRSSSEAKERYQRKANKRIKWLAHYIDTVSDDDIDIRVRFRRNPYPHTYIDIYTQEGKVDSLMVDPAGTIVCQHGKAHKGSIWLY